MRHERSGAAFKDFSALLSQAMQTREGTATSDLQRQALADLGRQSTPEQRQDAADRPQDDTNTRPRTDAGNSARTSTSTTAASARDMTSANLALAQRARRVSMLRTAPARTQEGVGASANGDPGTRGKAAVRKPGDSASASDSTAQAGQTVPTGTNTHRTVEEQARAASDPAKLATQPVDMTRLGLPSEQSLPTVTAPATTDPLVATPPPTGLTTLTLSPHLNILTPTQGVVNEQSLQAFAQSMGIDPTQFKQFLNPQAELANATGLRAGVTASDAQLSSLLPATPVAEGKPIDLSQVLPEGINLQELQVDLLNIPRRGNLEAASPSTLDVLGMREGNLTLDAVPGLQEATHTGTGEHTSDQGGAMTQAHPTQRQEATNAANATTPVARSMTEHFEKLSAKLATEMAARIHEQLSQGEWKMKFALKPANLGQVDVQLEMRDGKLAAVFQADNPMTQDLLQNGSQRLRDALSQMGLSQSSVWVGDGRGQGSQQGDRHTHPHGDTAAVAPRQSTSQEPVQAASAARRDSLSQLDFYA